MNTTIRESIALQTIQERLEDILQHVEGENRAKALLLDQQRREIQALAGKLADCRRHNEGQQQLINKLLNDISQYQLDIDWYRRTYEKRTFLGVIREKLFRK
jgi:DNA repair exonuclease SbcCD ATPase subunit